MNESTIMESVQDSSLGILVFRAKYNRVVFIAVPNGMDRQSAISGKYLQVSQ